MKNNISKILAEKDMTQMALSEAAKIDRAYLNRIISGKITPSIPTGLKISGALDLAIEDLFYIH